jgi:hypothetical protein
VSPLGVQRIDQVGILEVGNDALQLEILDGATRRRSERVSVRIAWQRSTVLSHLHHTYRIGVEAAQAALPRWIIDAPLCSPLLDDKKVRLKEVGVDINVRTDHGRIDVSEYIIDVDVAGDTVSSVQEFHCRPKQIEERKMSTIARAARMDLAGYSPIGTFAFAIGMTCLNCPPPCLFSCVPISRTL